MSTKEIIDLLDDRIQKALANELLAEERKDFVDASYYNGRRSAYKDMKNLLED